MSLKNSMIAGAIAALFAGTATMAAADGGVSVFNNSPRAQAEAASYWTEDRIAGAKPMAMGKVKSNEVTGQSFGSSVLDFSRSRIPPKANTADGYKSVGKLYFTIPGQGDFQCSASVIGKRLIVTAGHCVYSDGVGFHTNWTFIPGFDGSQNTTAKQRPLGTWNWQSATVTSTWINTHGTLPNNADFAILAMADQTIKGTVTKISKQTGSMTAVVGHLFDTHVTMLGYPCNFDSCGIMQRVDSGDHRPGSTATGNNAFEYGSDMTGGSSGGPWVENFGDPSSALPQGGYGTRNAVVGVTSYGYTDASVLILGASQFNSEFTSIYNTECGLSAGNC